jgi:hypothetical protein
MKVTCKNATKKQLIQTIQIIEDIEWLNNSKDLQSLTKSELLQRLSNHINRHLI